MMVNMKPIATINDKDIYFYPFSDMNFKGETLIFPESYFVSCFFFNETHWVQSEFESLIQKTLVSGCIGYCFHGYQCMKAHDLTDFTIIDSDFPEKEQKENDNDCITTTWHDEESLESTLFYLFNCATPSDKYRDNYSYAVFSFGNKEDNDVIHNLLQDPVGTIHKAMDQDRNIFFKGFQKLKQWLSK